MYQGQSITGNDNGPVSSSTQGSFHKIYRKKRCYSLVDKDQEGRGSSRWKYGHVSTQRDDNTGFQNKYFSGPGNFKPAQRNDSMQSYCNGNHSASPLNRESVKNFRQHLKRPNDRLRFNSVSEPEFDVPFVKKQKMDNYSALAPPGNFSFERRQDKRKVLLEDTTWMYKNQHAKMSGPYGVRQLMEGFYARFLQEDLPVYQFQEGKLGRQIMLKELIDNLESCSSLTHISSRNFDESFGEESCCHVDPCKTEEDMDLPPGFGGHSAQLSERLSSSRRHWSTALSSQSPDYEAAECGLPPGFEVLARKASLTEPYMSELGRRYSMGAGVSPGWSEGGEGMQASYEKFEPVVHGGSHSSHQGSSPHSEASFPMLGTKCFSRNTPQLVHGWGHLCPQDNSPSSQINCTSQGARRLIENSSRHATWALTSPDTRLLNVEAQTFSSPGVCIGLPVNMAYAQAANHGLLPTESSDISVTCGVTPLDLIYSELLTAVKRSYAKTVLSALIDEQLKCWIPCKDTLAKSLLADDSSHSRASSLSSAEFGALCGESSTFQSCALTSLPEQQIRSEEPSLELQAFQSTDVSCLDAHVGLAEVSVEARVAQCLDGSGSTDQSEHTEEQQCLSVGAFGTKNAGSTRSLKSLGNIIENFQQEVVDQREELQHQIRDEVFQEEGRFAGKVPSSESILDATYLDTQPSFLVYGRRKWKIKSLKSLMQITSELTPRDTKMSSSPISKKEVSMGMVPETVVQNEARISEVCDCCARTSVDGWSWREVARRAPSKFGSDFHTQSDTLSQAHHTELQKFSAAADASFIPKLKRSEAKLKLARSKIHEWGIFAIEPLEAGDFVIEYVGEVIRPRVSDIRERQYKKLGFGCRFLFHVDSEIVVDATKQGGFARFMNYSCDPNCHSEIVSLGGSKKVFIYAKKRIVSGEELTFDCKFELEDQKIACNCGSARCRGSQFDACR